MVNLIIFQWIKHTFTLCFLDLTGHMPVFFFLGFCEKSDDDLVHVDWEECTEFPDPAVRAG